MKGIKAFLLSSVLILLYCCNSQNFVDNSNSENPKDLVFSTEVEEDDISTRKSGNTWENGDAIGVFAFESGKPQSEATLDENLANRKFVTQGNGLFTPSEGQASYPSDKRDVIAYYPYIDNVSVSKDFTYVLDIADQSNLEKIDFLYSNNLVNFESGVKANLSFKHALPRLNLTLVSKEYDLTGAQVKLVGIYTKADFNLLTGKVYVDKTLKSTIPANTFGTHEAISLSALVLPTNETQTFKVAVVLADGTKFEWAVPADWKWEIGKKYTKAVQLSKEGGVEPEPEPGDRFGFFETPQRAKDIANTQFVVHNVPKNSSANIRYDKDGNPQRNFTLLYDTNYKIAYWVAYPHHPNYLGSTKRSNAWQYDPIVSSSDQVNLKSSWKEAYDRGHQIPSGDRTADRPLNVPTFYYTNMTAQEGPKMNQAIWANLEDHVRDYVRSHNDTVWVVTGAGLPENPNQIKYAHSKSGEASAIPTYYYKVLAKKVGGKYYTKGYLLDNKPYDHRDYERCKVTVKKLEELTGFTFFDLVPAEDKDKIVDSQW